ncbi:uncharacterized protein LOC116203524 isoform X2 [Punica granatum]|uniref:Uncharacterized protein LOC116203524 isoform X2 n=1 Tax=Punica granatum TaxID=22663 RepID=A0A6P8DI40_PUNGR|nr:uncharacterized protein LOC116203524 isoform X2 [Punica granatum]
MDHSDYYASYDQQHVQGTYDPSQPSQPHCSSSIAGPATTAAAQSSSSYYSYDPQHCAAYYHSQDYANYYYQQHHQQPPETHQQQQHSQNSQLYQEPHLPSHQNPYYEQAAQNPSSDPWQSSVSAHRGIHHPMGQSESIGKGGRIGNRQSKRGGKAGSRGAQQGPPMEQEPGSAPGRLPRMVRCELCRVECNAPEILEQHKNGKRHKKNLRVHEELQNLKKQMSEPEKPAENLPAETRPHEEGACGAGMKRKMKGGRGGKFLKAESGLRRPVGSAQPKEPAFPFICDLCNVKCESQVVFNTHLTGKKHLSKMKRFQRNQSLSSKSQVFGPPCASSSLPVSSTSVTLEANNQTSGSEPLALLSVNGVSSSDPQVLLAQIIMDYVRSQTHGVPQQGQALVPGSGSGTQNQQGQQIHDSETALETSALPPGTRIETKTMTEVSSGEAVSCGPASCSETAKDIGPQ